MPLVAGGVLPATLAGMAESVSGCTEGAGCGSVKSLAESALDCEMCESKVKTQEAE